MIRLGTMLLLALIALLAGQPATSSPARSVFTSEERVALSQQARRDCGFATPQELIGLPDGKRNKALTCFVRATVKHSASLLPREIEPGAIIVSVSEFQGMPVFVMQFEADHPRALVPKDQPSDYDRLLSNQTCQDKWLGGLIDAGMVNGVQAGTAIVYKFQNMKRENLAIIAVGQCFNEK